MPPVSPLRILFRHRVALLAVAAVTASTALGFWMSALPTHSVAAMVWVTPPQPDAANPAVNPLLDAGAESHAVVAAAIAAEAGGDATRRSMGRQGLSTDFEVEPVDARSPLVELTVRHRDASVAETTAVVLLSRLEEALGAAQGAVDVDARVGLRTLDLGVPVADHRQRDRLVAATLVVGLVTAPLLAIALDAMARSVEQRRARSPHPSRRTVNAPSGDLLSPTGQ